MVKGNPNFDTCYLINMLNWFKGINDIDSIFFLKNKDSTWLLKKYRDISKAFHKVSCVHD